MKARLLFIFIFFNGLLPAQSTFQKTYAYTGYEQMDGMISTIDHGFLLWGHNLNDNQILRLDSLGNMLWSKVYNYSIRNILKTSDGGFLLTADWTSLIKIDGSGNIQWVQFYSPHMNPYSIKETLDNGYVITGEQDDELFIQKISSTGALIWLTNAGYALEDEKGFDVAQVLPDSSYIVIGKGRYTPPGSIEGDISTVTKFDKNGNFVWDKEFLTSGGLSYPFQVLQISSGKVILFYGNSDLVFIEIDLSGTILSTKRLPIACQFRSNQVITRTQDNGFVICGRSSLMNFDLIKLDSLFNISWTQSYGGAKYDYPHSIIATTDGGYAIGGHTQNFTTGFTNYYIVKVDSLGNSPCNTIAAPTYNFNTVSITTANYLASSSIPFLNPWSPPGYTPVLFVMTDHDACVCVPPVANLNFNGTATNMSTWADSWIWDFGDGTIDTTGATGSTTHYYADGDYYQCLTVINSCGSNSICDSVHIQNMPISVSENYNTLKFDVLPNPSNGKFVLETNGIVISNVELYDMRGKRIFNKIIKDRIKEFDFSELSKGLYYLKIYSGNDFVVRKIVLQ